MPVNILYGVLHGDNMAVPVMIDTVNHTGQCGGFPGARRTGDQHQPAVSVVPVPLVVRQQKHFLGYSQLFRIREFKTDHTDHRRQGAPLPEHIDTETPSRKIILSGK